MSRKKKIVIGITGASGTIYAIDLLKKLHTHPEVETHVVVSNWAKQNLKLEAAIDLKNCPLKLSLQLFAIGAWC